ncbi:putative aliphatic sulfonates transport permease protein SsuC [compost metagenome]
MLTLAFGIGSGSKIAFAFLESFYPIVAASIFAFRGIRTRLVWAAQSMGATNLQILLRVMIPAALPGVFTGLRIGLPVSVLVVIVAEMIGDGRGLGFYIADASLSFRTDKVFAGIIVVGLLGFVCDRVLVFVSNVALPGRR